MKKAFFIFCISLLITSALWGISFNMTHVVALDARTIFSFWKPDGSMTTWDDNTKTFTDSVNNSALAILGVQYDNRFTVSSIVLSFGQMIGDSTGLVCPYLLTFLDPSTGTSLEQRSDCIVSYASDLPDGGNSGAGSVTIYKTGHTFNKYSSNAYDSDEIARIMITIDFSEIPPDTYRTQVQVTVNYT